MAVSHRGFQDRNKYKEIWTENGETWESAQLTVAGYQDDEEFTRQAISTRDILNAHLDIKTTDTVLDIGCGFGRVGKVLSPHCKKWIGCDISGSMLKHAKKYLDGLPNTELVELSTVGLQEIPDESVDVVYCTVVFMHLLEWDRYTYIKEAFRVMKPNGRCFFDNADITSSHGWQLFMSSWSVPSDQRTAWLSMVSSGDELEAYATHAGFSDVRIDRWHDAWVGVIARKGTTPA